MVAPTNILLTSVIVDMFQLLMFAGPFNAAQYWNIWLVSVTPESIGTSEAVTFNPVHPKNALLKLVQAIAPHWLTAFSLNLSPPLLTYILGNAPVIFTWYDVFIARSEKTAFPVTFVNVVMIVCGVSSKAIVAV